MKQAERRKVDLVQAGQAFLAAVVANHGYSQGTLCGICAAIRDFRKALRVGQKRLDGAGGDLKTCQKYI